MNTVTGQEVRTWWKSLSSWFWLWAEYCRKSASWFGLYINRAVIGFSTWLKHKCPFEGLGEDIVDNGKALSIFDNLLNRAQLCIDVEKNHWYHSGGRHWFYNCALGQASLLCSLPRSRKRTNGWGWTKYRISSTVWNAMFVDAIFRFGSFSPFHISRTWVPKPIKLVTVK